MISQKGGSFPRQKDTEQDEKVFGKLIIQPPTDHTGGELVIYDGNSESHKVVDFGQKDGKRSFTVHFAAYWSDMEYEMRPIENGYQVMFVYSLFWVQGKQDFTYLYFIYYYI